MLIKGPFDSVATATGTEGAWTIKHQKRGTYKILISKNRRHFLPRSESESTFKGRVIIYVMLDVMLDIHLTEQSFILITRN